MKLISDLNLCGGILFVGATRFSFLMLTDGREDGLERVAAFFSLFWRLLEEGIGLAICPG